MLLYPPTYTAPEPPEPIVLSEAEVTWVRGHLQAHMSENRGYRLRELIDFIQDEIATQHPNRHYGNDVIRTVILELDAEWGWHPPVEPVE